MAANYIDITDIYFLINTKEQRHRMLFQTMMQLKGGRMTRPKEGETTEITEARSRRKRKKVKIKTANLDPGTMQSGYATPWPTHPNFLPRSADLATLANVPTT